MIKTAKGVLNSSFLPNSWCKQTPLMYPRRLLWLLSRTKNGVWNFFEKLAWDTYEFEQARGTLRYLTYGEYTFHATPQHQDHFRDSYDQPSRSCVIPSWCNYCESFDHDVHNCSYHDYVDVTCASLLRAIYELTDKMIETMKETIVEHSHCLN